VPLVLWITDGARHRRAALGGGPIAHALHQVGQRRRQGQEVAFEPIQLAIPAAHTKQPITDSLVPAPLECSHTDTIFDGQFLPCPAEKTHANLAIYFGVAGSSWIDTAPLPLKILAGPRETQST